MREKETSLAFLKRNENRIGKESREGLVKKEQAMKMIAGICLLLLTFGMILGWFLLGGFSGSAIGLCLAGCLALPLYCLASVFRRTSPVVEESSFGETASAHLDPSQLPASAYNRLNDGSGM